MRTMKEPDVRRQEILEAAIRVFAAKGYEKTVISDIAAESGISQGLCYRYFRSKEEIYDLAIEEYAEFIVAESCRSLDYEKASMQELIDTLNSRADLYYTLEKDKPELYLIFHREGSSKLHDQLSLKICEKLLPVATGIICKAVEHGELHVREPEAMAYYIVYGQMGIFRNREMTEAEKEKMICSSREELMRLMRLK